MMLEQKMTNIKEINTVPIKIKELLLLLVSNPNIVHLALLLV